MAASLRLPAILLALTLLPFQIRAADTLPAPPLIPAPDTTLITSPLNPDGTPDYLTYLNTQLSKNITAENNAVIPLLRALGPKFMMDEKLRPLILNALKLKLPDDGPYFTQFIVFARKYQNDLPPGSPEKAADLDPLFQAMDVAAKTPWTATQYPVLAKWLTANQDALRQIAAASRLPRFYVPLISAKSPPSFVDATAAFSPGGIRMLANALCCEAMLHLAANDIPAARADLLTVHRLARLVAQLPFVIHNLVAVAMDKAASNAELAILRSPNFTADQARQIIADLAALPEITPNDPAIDQAEHFYLLNLLMPAIHGNPAGTLDFFTLLSGPDLFKSPPTPRNDLDQVDWNIALRAVNRRNDAGDAAGNLPLAKDRHAALESLIKEQEDAHLPTPPFSLYSPHMPSEEDRRRNAEAYLKKLSEFLSCRPNESVADFSNRIAIFFTCVDGSGEKSVVLIDRNVATQRLTLLAAALMLYHLDKKTFPNTLEPLLPYLPNKKIPLDPFTNKSFLYHPTSADSYVLYSTGDNAQDDQAHDQSSTPKADDIVIRIP